jgi:hypothetical protein
MLAFREPLVTGCWHECYPCTVKHGGFKQVLSIDVYKPNTSDGGIVLKKLKISAQPYWELQTLYRETLFNYEMVDLKRRRTNFSR